MGDAGEPVFMHVHMYVCMYACMGERLYETTNIHLYRDQARARFGSKTSKYDACIGMQHHVMVERLVNMMYILECNITLKYKD